MTIMYTSTSILGISRSFSMGRVKTIEKMHIFQTRQILTRLKELKRFEKKGNIPSYVLLRAD